MATNPRLVSFLGGATGTWQVTQQRTIVGEPLPVVTRLEIVSGREGPWPEDVVWSLSGVTSNDRYVEQDERDALRARQEAWGRTTLTRAALIPIRKNDRWWGLTQDERRRIFAQTSSHVAIGLDYLPAIARRLHHCRDLAAEAPFDFLTLFDFAAAAEPAFDELVRRLRDTEEWTFVDREIDLRLERIVP